MTHLTAISGKDGEVLLREENISFDKIGKYPPLDVDNKAWTDFERTVQSYPIHGFTLKPGERVEADSVELVWQFQGHKQWHTCQNVTPEIAKENNWDTRQAYVKVTPKEEDNESKWHPETQSGTYRRPVHHGEMVKRTPKDVTPKPLQQKDVALLDKEEIAETRDKVLRTSLNTALFSAHLNGKENSEQSYFEWEKNNDVVTNLIGLIKEILLPT